MKKIIVLIGIIMLLSACGSKTEKSEVEGVILEETTTVESATTDESTSESEASIEEVEVTTEDASNEDEDTVEVESQLEEVEVIKPVITLYKDEASGKYGYNGDGQPITEAIYAHATDFVDGYAVVSLESVYEGAEVIDEEMNVVLSNELGIYNYGYGYFGLVQDFQGSQESYNKVRLMNALGVDLLNQTVFEVKVHNESLILVANHLKGWLVDETGQEIDEKIIDPKLVENYKYAEIVDGNFVLYMDSNDNSIYQVIDAGGAVLDSTVPSAGAHYTDLGNGYDIKDKVIIDKRFITVTVPEISLSGDQRIFEEANGWFANLYDPQSYSDLRVDEVYDTFELNFESRRIGDVLEIDMHYYWYGFGAAHPNYAVESYHINLLDGTSHNLTGLFSDGMIFDTLTKKVRDIANEDSAGYFDVNEIVVNANTSYHISNDAITFYYSPYEIGPYAMGIPEFTISFEALEPYMNKASTYYKNLMTEQQ